MTTQFLGYQQPTVFKSLNNNQQLIKTHEKMRKIKQSIITKGVENYRINKDINRVYVPKAGDLAVFEILSIGKHKRVQALNGSNLNLFPGDQVLMSFGTRYATNQFEGYVPDSYQDVYQILGGGGIVGTLESMHVKFEDIGPTEVRLVGYAVDEGNNVINSLYNNIEKESFDEVTEKDYDIYLSVGASMDSGKTTTAGYFCRGLMLSGKKVAYIKLTGTAYTRDKGFVRDAGAEITLDFSDCGFPSTYLVETDDVLDIFATLSKRIEEEIPDLDALVVEIADGVVQKETFDLLSHKKFMSNISGVVLSCPDSLSAAGGIDILAKMNITPVVVGGLFTASPLMVREVEAMTDLPVFTLPDFIESNGDRLNTVLNFKKVKLKYYECPA